MVQYLRAFFGFNKPFAIFFSATWTACPRLGCYFMTKKVHEWENQSEQTQANHQLPWNMNKKYCNRKPLKLGSCFHSKAGQYHAYFSLIPDFNENFFSIVVIQNVGPTPHCEYAWLTNCYRSHQCSVRCHALSHSRDHKMRIPSSPIRWIGCNQNNKADLELRCSWLQHLFSNIGRHQYVKLLINRKTA